MGWLAEAFKLPWANMHQRLHRIRMMMPPRESPVTFHPEDARPFKATGLKPPKPPKMVSQVPTIPTRRDTSVMPPDA